jgi:hypothetical protein
MILKTDDNSSPVQGTYKKIPLQSSGSMTLSPGQTKTITLSVPQDVMWFIKSWSVTKGSDVDVQSIKVDGNDTHEIVGVTNTESRYGVVINAESEVTTTALLPSSLTGDQTLDFQVDGYKVEL